MEAIVFIAAIAAIYEIKRRSLEDALLNVFLPVMLLIPGFYCLRLPHLPTLAFYDTAILPIAFVLFAKHLRNWKFQRADIWLFLFVGGLFYSELVATGPANAGLVAFGGIVSAIVPYSIGKLMLEQDNMRERFVRRFVLCLFIVAVISVTEFRLGQNMFTNFFGILFPGQRPWIAQLRGGFVRVVGPYSQAILAGMIFLVALLFSSWLGMVDAARGGEKRYFGLRKSTIFTGGIIVGLLMTQSRGPWVGAILAYAIARIGRAKNMKRATIITLILVVIGGTVGYIKAEQYTSGSIWDAKDLEQENAIYRRELLENYKPVVEKGGLFGYGVIDWPRMPGQPSIDNEFLFLQITQGKLGFWSFILLAVESCWLVLKAVRKTRQRSDIYFMLCLGGSILGVMLTLSTVYMGAQSYPLTFLLMGWCQSLRQTQETAVLAEPVATGRFRFRRVFA